MSELKKSDFYYDLPKDLIAQTPAEPRDSSRLLVYDKTAKTIEHRIFHDIIDYLVPGDVLVVNDTKVIPARLYAVSDTGAKAEILLLRRIDERRWEVLTKPGRRCKIGKHFTVSDKLSFMVEDITETGERIVSFEFEGSFEAILDEVGTMPLPPYIKKKLRDQGRYQTVYARESGSAAAPTAGLHFTDELLKRIQAKGVEVVKILLHVGLGTFRPVKEENVSDHVMHSEYFEVSEDAARRINAAKAEGRRVIAVGTTSVRTLETVSGEDGKVTARKGDTSIFIYPPYRFKCVDALITNFHLPESTLLMLVASMTGREEILAVYDEAVKERYRFFSFGDAMFIH